MRVSDLINNVCQQFTLSTERVGIWVSWLRVELMMREMIEG